MNIVTSKALTTLVKCQNNRKVRHNKGLAVWYTWNWKFPNTPMAVASVSKHIHNKCLKLLTFNYQNNIRRQNILPYINIYIPGITVYITQGGSLHKYTYNLYE